MKLSFLLVIFLSVTIIAFSVSARVTNSKKETKTFKKHEDEHGHGKADEHGHSEEKADEHGHGEEKADEHDHGEEKTDEHDHGGEKDDEHDHGGGEKVGPDKAITEVNEEKGFKLSKEAFNSLDVKLQEVGINEISIRKSSLVTSKNKTGVYRYRDGYFKFIPVIIKRRDDSAYLIESRDLHPKDQIVRENVGLIAITDVYSTDTAEYGHGH